MPLPPDFKPSDFSIGSISDRQLVNLAKLAGAMDAGDALTPQLQEFALLIMENARTSATSTPAASMGAPPATKYGRCLACTEPA
jgi:hypothetical protein